MQGQWAGADDACAAFAKVNQVSTPAISAQAPIPLTMGIGEPSTNCEITPITTAPVTICVVPSKADAVPAI